MVFIGDYLAVIYLSTLRIIHHIHVIQDSFHIKVTNVRGREMNGENV